MHLAPQTLGGFSDGFRSVTDPFKPADDVVRDKAPLDFDDQLDVSAATETAD